MLLLLHKANNLPMPRQPKMVWAVWGCNKIHACSKAIRGQSGKHGALKFPRFLYSPRPMPMRGKFLNGSGASGSPARRCCNIEPPNKICGGDVNPLFVVCSGNAVPLSFEPSTYLFAHGAAHLTQRFATPDANGLLFFCPPACVSRRA